MYSSCCCLHHLRQSQGLRFLHRHGFLFTLVLCHTCTQPWKTHTWQSQFECVVPCSAITWSCHQRVLLQGVSKYKYLWSNLMSNATLTCRDSWQRCKCTWSCWLVTQIQSLDSNCIRVNRAVLSLLCCCLNSVTQLWSLASSILACCLCLLEMHKTNLICLPMSWMTRMPRLQQIEMLKAWCSDQVRLDSLDMRCMYLSVMAKHACSSMIPLFLVGAEGQVARWSSCFQGVEFGQFPLPAVKPLHRIVCLWPADFSSGKSEIATCPWAFYQTALGTQ